MHGRKGLEKEILVDVEEEKRIFDRVEKDIEEIRLNQEKRFRGEPVGEKKMPGRETGEIYQEYRYVEFKYDPDNREDGDNGSGKNGNNNRMMMNENSLLRQQKYGAYNNAAN